MTTGVMMMSSQNGRSVVVLTVGNVQVTNNEKSEDTKKITYPSKKQIDKYRTPKIPKNTRK